MMIKRKFSNLQGFYLVGGLVCFWLSLPVSLAQSGCTVKDTSCQVTPSREVVIITPWQLQNDDVGTYEPAQPTVTPQPMPELPDVWPGEMVIFGNQKRRVWTTRTTPLPQPTVEPIAPVMILPQINPRLRAGAGG